MPSVDDDRIRRLPYSCHARWQAHDRPASPRFQAVLVTPDTTLARSRRLLHASAMIGSTAAARTLPRKYTEQASAASTRASNNSDAFRTLLRSPSTPINP